MARQTPPNDPDAVSRALRSWTNQLIDTGGRNRLLYFKHLKRGTLDLAPDAGADPAIAAALQRGRSIKLSDCFPAGSGADASQRARWILRKAREHEEEQGIRTLYLGWRFATWSQSGPGPATPNAPLLLAAAELTPQGRMGDDFTLSIADDWEVNPSMAQLLKREFGAELDQAALEDLLQADTLDDAAILNQLRRAYDAIPGFDIHDGLVLGTFSYAKLPMVRDLEAAEDAVAQHPLVAAIAGDPQAQLQLRDTQRNGAHRESVPGGNNLPPSDEFLVLDADGTQSEVINAAVAGANLVVVGPPGTGKSQTIANLLATLTARGRSTLFVAEKRAAIDAVVKRLNSVGLGDLVLDLHEGMRSRRQTAEQLAAALQAAHTAHAPNVETLQRTLTQSRNRLSRAEQELHQPREPWGLSIYQLQSRILGMDDSEDIGLRIRAPALNALHGEALEAAKDELAEYINLGGAVLDASPDAAWGAAHRASTLSTNEQVGEAVQLLDDLGGRLLPEVEHELAEIAQHLGIDQPATVAMTQALLDALARFGPLHGRFTPAVFQADDAENLLSALDPAERGPLAGLSETDSTPWGVTVEDLDLRIQALAPTPETRLRLRGDRLKRLRGDLLAQAMTDLEEYVDRGGAELDTSDAAPWSAAHRASTLWSEAVISEAERLLDLLSGELLPALEREITSIAQQLGIQQPVNVPMTQALLEALTRFGPLHGRFTSTVFQADDVENLLSALDPAERGPFAGLNETDPTPWGVTVDELDSRIQVLGQAPETSLRLRGDLLKRLGGDLLTPVMADLEEYVDRGGAELDASDAAPWSAAHRASTLRSKAAVDETDRLLDRLSGDLLPALEREITSIAQQLGIAPPPAPEAMRMLLEALERFAPLRVRLTPAVFEADDLDNVVAQLEIANQGPLAGVGSNRRTPWGVTAGELDLRVQALGDAPLCDLRLRGDTLRALAGDSLQRVIAHLVEYVNRGGADLDASLGAWSPAHQAAAIDSDERVATAADLLDDLSSKLLPGVERELRGIAERLSINVPATIDEAHAALAAIRQMQGQREWFTSAVFDANVETLLGDLEAGQGGAIRQIVARLFNAPYRRAVRNSRELLRDEQASPWEAYARLLAFSEACEAWRGIAPDGPTAAVWEIDIAPCETALERFSDTLAMFHDVVGFGEADLDWAAQRECLDALERERAVLLQLPHLSSLRNLLEDASVAEFAREAERRGWSGNEAAQALDEAWTRSVLAELTESEPTWRAPYRAARASADEWLVHRDMPTAWAYRWLREFADARDLWQRATATSPTPAVWTIAPDESATALERFSEALAAFCALAALDDADLDWPTQRARLNALQSHRAVLFQLQRLASLRARLQDAAVLDFAREAQQHGWNGGNAAQALSDAWTRSVLDEVQESEPTSHAPYRAARARVDELLTHPAMPTTWAAQWLREFIEAQRIWQSAVVPAPTAAVWTISPANCATALAQFSAAADAFADLAALKHADLDWPTQRTRLDALQDRRAVLSQLPRLASLRARLQDAAILDFAREAQQHGWTGDRAAQALSDAWTRSVLDEVQESEPTSHAPYRAARARVDELLTHPAMPTAWVTQWLREFVRAQRTWQSAVASAPTAAVWTASPENCATALAQFSEAADAFADLAALEDADLDWAAQRAQIDSLQRDRTVAFRLPRLHDLRASLKQRGMARLVAAVHQRGLDGHGAVRAFEDAWTRSVLDAVSADAPIFASFDASGHDAAVAEFCNADRQHIAQSPHRVVRAWAEAAVDARNQHPEQSQLIMREANRKRRHLPTRDLFQQAPDVLTALKPCWVMSPLVVAQLLPLDGEPPFDVVVFDEASQIPPADAVSSLLRGRQAIVAGDPKQLPPTSFFTSSSEDEDEENDQDAPLTQDVESILDAMSTLLPMPWGSRTLGWHYRSKDERLIAFSNHHVYDRRLTTFPGALPDDCLEHVEVPFEPDASWVSGSYSPEVQRVVELILRHAAQRPRETLGVIALGAAHANRIAETLRLARRDRPELDDFFSEASPEPFFVKNLERVQGDERDAIILTVGYGRTEHGRMRYNFGPINQEGGFRRLNVAVTRAKRRMTVVSCFSANNMDPARVTNQGVRMLRDYIEYAAGGGRKLGGVVNAPPLNSFEIDIKTRLEKRGLNLQPQYGVSGYRIDFAAMHPDEPGRPILAIEADGAQYHSAQAARDRDRLRQENLERLGWRFHRIWSTEWFRNPELEADRAAAAYQQALAADRSAPSSAPPPQELPEEPPEEPPPSPSRDPRPNVPPGRKIDDYSPRQLINIIQWIESDGRLRTEDELLVEAMQELGFKRRGTKIVAALTQAIHRAR